MRFCVLFSLLSGMGMGVDMWMEMWMRCDDAVRVWALKFASHSPNYTDNIVPRSVMQPHSRLFRLGRSRTRTNKTKRFPGWTHPPTSNDISFCFSSR